jgi:hypothetical protein
MFIKLFFQNLWFWNPLAFEYYFMVKFLIGFCLYSRQVFDGGANEANARGLPAMIVPLLQIGCGSNSPSLREHITSYICVRICIPRIILSGLQAWRAA